MSGINVRSAPGEQYGVAALDHLLHFGGGSVQGNADCFSASRLYGSFILRERAFRVIGISGVRHGNGNARGHVYYSNILNASRASTRLLDFCKGFGLPVMPNFHCQ